ncbi:MAG: Membrane-bound protein LytA precursor [Firmicutes bacterium ADurb.Bin182]|nr:MAG: Membrane-bound protein LytA precursor [Firmicutes bacterium ADurb.Bin182]
MKKSVRFIAVLLAASLVCCACAEKPATRTTEGEYVGLIDNNFIEIKISGLPEEEAYASFMLSEEVRGEFEELKLNSGELVRFEYERPDEGPPVIVRIERID